jgi:hypothetical protein
LSPGSPSRVAVARPRLAAALADLRRLRPIAAHTIEGRLSARPFFKSVNGRE